MKESVFFEKQTISSKIKASIISEYFPSYCKIIVKKHKPKSLRYIDLFAGPGIYEDESLSTPILIGKRCQADDLLRNSVHLLFNDNKYSSLLEQNFLKYFPEGTFPYKPRFGNKTVGVDQDITRFLMKSTHSGKFNQYPSLLFIDPFGYKGIETKVLGEFLKNWGNEIFLFVNTKRIHPALENEKFDSLMSDLFPTTLATIRLDRRYKLSVSERLKLIIDSLGKEYEALLGERVFYTAFKFQEEDSEATSHFILHLTKGARGYDLIKTIYNDFANVGTIFDGVNTYTFDAKKFDDPIIDLFDFKSLNIDKLKDDMYFKYSNKTISAHNLFETEHIATLYSKSHFTDALRRLVEEGKLDPVFTDDKEHRVSVLISKDCILKFK
ncbi:three-Cys-motif partner protein TcmP [Dyadobacter sp. CY323]|uniref:three-Cys-motif partner protein TcmP n=1 Tax=Dyadobacter sp. CY323 TaxID=2907302 RepID=UPI001F24B62E|nr:three-Cys-motif partner protein TcmP [Dyadobacter sp. CY323]MCE6988046.1 three-Cys-motif partner protein TcmP [Dyadobacter sp. CY323]